MCYITFKRLMNLMNSQLNLEIFNNKELHLVKIIVLFGGAHAQLLWQ
jgi:hypothetical protein